MKQFIFKKSPEPIAVNQALISQGFSFSDEKGYWMKKVGFMTLVATNSIKSFDDASRYFGKVYFNPSYPNDVRKSCYELSQFMMRCAQAYQEEMNGVAK
jgi:hypothetical protein